MPRIREYTQQVSVSGPQASGRASAGDFGAGLGEGLASFGRAVSTSGEAVGEIDDRFAAFDAEKKAAAAQGLWKERLDQLKKKHSEELASTPIDQDAPDFTEEFKKEYGAWHEKTVTGISNPKAQRLLDTRLASLQSNLTDNAISYEATERAKWQTNGLKEIFDKGENAIRSDPSSRDSVIETNARLVNAMPYGDALTKKEIIRKETQRAWDADLDSRVATLETNPHARPEDVRVLLAHAKDKSKGWQGNMTPEKYDATLTRLQKLEKLIKDKSQQEYVAGFDEAMDQIEVTGADAGRYTAEEIKKNVADPIVANRMVKRQAMSRAIGKEAVWVKDAPDSEIMARLDPAKVNEQLSTSKEFHRDYGAVQAATKAFHNRLQQWKDDRVGYTLGVSAAAKNSYEQYAKNPSIETAKVYADTVMAEQRRLSPGSRPAILTDAMAQQVKAQFEAVPRNEQGAAQAVGVLQSHMQTWGPQYWPQVVSDLRASKALTDEQYVAASLFDKPQYRYVAEDLLKASLVKEDDLVKSIPGDGARKAARDAAIGALQPLRGTLMHMADGQESYSAFENALTKLVLFKGYQSGADKSGDAEDLARKIVLDSYHPIDGESYRVPVSQDIDSVKSAASSVLRNLHKYDFASLPRDLDGLRPGDAKERYISSLQINGKLVNNGDAGLRLIDERGRQVYSNDGGKPKALAWTWGDLEAMALEEKEKAPKRRFFLGD